MIKQTPRNDSRIKRHLRIRQTLSGTALKPRLNVFRSNKQIYAQLINDELGVTLCQASSLEMKIANGGNALAAKAVGAEVAKRALAMNITEVVFDRGGYQYHGRVKALAEAAREAGLKF